jgi:GNAT superfamily N-acetyltransferase
MKQRKGEYEIDTDKRRLNLGAIHRFLSQESYWAKNRTLEQTLTAVENSLCFGVYRGREQVGFARVVTDGDVFILEQHRGKGLSKWLMETIIAQPDMQGLRRWVLATNDAHSLYRQYGFENLQFPERWMERAAVDAY